ncbi:helix-turn-helix domain-containing protein [Ligilactobacillus agilis]|uniref:helix-turn-helix domain-containing protein n=1 Tax=Ligilactobacillus agilis TaxID=1601 RepID=UPI00254B8265|nr:helix-turn-helix domain-containing protein [Ligilactobacillus agilis]MDK6809201.1 DUF4115 domain-containing protein [Ligilactobacillus agilis]
MSIGQTLKDARSDKGLTLDDLQQNTKIQKRYLIAIEEDNFAALPGEFYVRAFVKQYAEAVDLDSKELLLQLAEQTGKDKEATPEEVVDSRTKKRKLTESNKAPSKFETLYTYLPTIIIVVVVVAIVGSIYFVTLNNKKADAQIDSSSSKVSVSSDVSSTTKKASSTKKVSSEKKTEVATKKAKSTKKTSKKTSSKQKITSTQVDASTFTYELTGSKAKTTIKLGADATAWMAVSANGSQQWQGTLSSGASHTVTLPTGTESITFNLGNSKATTITINGQKFNFLKEDATTTVRTIVINVKD